MGKTRVPYSGLIYEQIKDLKPGTMVTVPMVMTGNKSKFSTASVSSFFNKLCNDGALKKTNRRGMYEVTQKLESYAKRHPFRASYTPHRRKKAAVPRYRKPRHALPSQAHPELEGVKIIDDLLNVMARAEPVLLHIKEDIQEVQRLKAKLAKVKDIL